MCRGRRCGLALPPVGPEGHGAPACPRGERQSPATPALGVVRHLRPSTRVQTFHGQKVNLGGVVYYGVIRAWTWRDSRSFRPPSGAKYRVQLASLTRRGTAVPTWATRPRPYPGLAKYRVQLANPTGRGKAGATRQQGYLTAYTTRLVTSVVCRGFIPREVTLQFASQPQGFLPGAVASLLRCMARRPIRIQLRRAGQHRRVPARILT
ncbi:hypothetical protein BO70DRAFT_433770 [Aspergillus heteromorphus CBS 117.55]|uniref:Uncharacterized protein n=1 Tax=Aspergillus heteromorphus CBS 117.55 TaxID=1448321 RepID=A0A317UPB5_9EURO|nr:hypothetical protein BO70DRAFT_433770 [Aspergillus heteromorphus CBS 117.55]